jgi:[ribosomal protein S5]-alanine N-acetyltransferase
MSGPTSVTRLLAVSDAPRLAEQVTLNRDFLTPFDPVRDDAFFTIEGQRAEIAAALGRFDEGLMVPHVVLDGDGAVVGRINLNSIIRGAFQSASLGYWVAQHANGRGLASSAVGRMTRLAFDSVGLHRVEAGTLVTNVRSQHVLERNGFVRFGLAPRYLRIAGEWQDHVLFQRLADEVKPLAR